LTASPTSGGTVSGGGSFNSGTSATAVATAKSGYGFVNWTDGSTVLSTSPSYTFTVISNRALVANFGQLVAISTSALPAADGSVTGGGNLAIGSTATLQATAKAGFGFVNWTEAGKVVSTSATYSFKVTAKRTLVANFAKFFSVSVSATPLAGGTVTGAGNFKTGTSVTVQATVNVGYAFVNWTEGGKVVCSTASYKFNATANRNLVANFIQTFTVTTSASPANEGTTSGGGAFKSGNSATVKATAKAGFKFVNWTEGQTVASSAASYKFTVTANRTLVANFAKK